MRELRACGNTEDQDQKFVAQRVFSKSDTARMLQVAIPRGQNDFGGIVAGSARVHRLTASISPLMLRFAVIDRTTGVVLFHSDDTRSLSENFFVETEQNEALKAAAATAKPTFLTLNYVGDRHRLIYLPMDGVPWGIAVFYPVAKISELSAQPNLTETQFTESRRGIRSNKGPLMRRR